MELKIIDVGYCGEGIAKADGKVCFVPFSLKDETVEVDVIKQTDKFNECELIEVLEPSKSRVTPPCPYFTKCGGCDIQHMTYQKQLEFKKELVKKTFLKISALDVDVCDVISSPNQFNYRNKMAFVCGEKGHTFLGMYKKNSHEIVEINKCLLAPDEINNIFSVVNKFIQEYGISAYDENTKTGLLKHVVVRKVDDVISVILVTTNKDFPRLNILVEMLPKNIQLFLNINNDKNKILTTNFIHIYGQKEIFKTDFGVTYRVSPFTFLQINDGVKQKLYSYILDQVNSDNIIDAYSGAGLMSAILSKNAKKVTAIEISRSACRDAEKLMKNNNINNVEIICDDCAKVLPNLKNLAESTLILDPPRSGVDKKILKVLNKTNLEKIIYISCNPKTLARDILELSSYKIESVQPFDMFPETAEVETVVILSK